MHCSMTRGYPKDGEGLFTRTRVVYGSRRMKYIAEYPPKNTIELSTATLVIESSTRAFASPMHTSESNFSGTTIFL